MTKKLLFLSMLLIPIISHSMTEEEYYNVAQQNIETGDYKSAIENLNKSIEKNPKYIKSYIDRGFSKAVLEQYEGAIKDFNKAIELDSTIASIYYMRGLAYEELTDYDQAIEDYNLAIKIKPDYGLPYSARALSKIYLGQKTSGCKDLQKAKELGALNAEQYIEQYCEK